MLEQSRSVIKFVRNSINWCVSKRVLGILRFFPGRGCSKFQSQVLGFQSLSTQWSVSWIWFHLLVVLLLSGIPGRFRFSLTMIVFPIIAIVCVFITSFAFCNLPFSNSFVCILPNSHQIRTHMRSAKAAHICVAECARSPGFRTWDNYPARSSYLLVA